MTISWDRTALTALFPENIAVAIKLREGVSPQEVVERVLRKQLLCPLDTVTFHSIEEAVERELREKGVQVVASVEENQEAPHGVVVTLTLVSDNS